MYEVLPWLILIAFLICVSYFMLKSWDVVVSGARKEEKRTYEQRVENEAERRFNNAIETAEYRIHYRPIELINESDIDWE